MNKNQSKKNTILTKEQLDEFIDEATVDAYDEYEQRTGFSTMIDDNVAFPFPAKVVDEEVMVTGVAEDDNNILAICQRNNKEYKVNILDLDADFSNVDGSEWIVAYRAWNRGQ